MKRERRPVQGRPAARLFGGAGGQERRALQLHRQQDEDGQGREDVPGQLPAQDMEPVAPVLHALPRDEQQAPLHDVPQDAVGSNRLNQSNFSIMGGLFGLITSIDCAAFFLDTQSAID